MKMRKSADEPQYNSSHHAVIAELFSGCTRACNDIQVEFVTLPNTSELSEASNDSQSSSNSREGHKS